MVTMRDITKILLLFFVGTFYLGGVFSQNIKNADSTLTISNIDATQVNNYWQTCLLESNNNDNVQGAYYVGHTVNPKYGYSYSATNSQWARSVLDTTSMLVYNPGTFSTNGQFKLLSNITPNGGNVKITQSTYGIPIVDNTIGRSNMAGLFILKGEYRTVLLGSNNSSDFLAYRTDYNQTTPFYISRNYSFINTPVTRYSCAGYYVAKCGDGVVDDSNKLGGLNTDGKHGILVNGQIIPWTLNSPNEICDDGVNNGKPGHCNLTCDGYVAQISAPTCSLTVTTGQNSTYNISWNIVGNFNPTQINITPPLGNTRSYNVNTNNGTYNVMPNGYGNFNISMTVSNSAGSNTCTSSFNISQPEKKLCGDGKIDRPNDNGVYEECDNGPNFGNGCDNKCKLMTPSCSLIADSQYQLIGNHVTFTANTDSWAKFLSFNLGDTIGGSPNIIYTSNIIFPYQYTFASTMTYNQVLTVQNNHPIIATGVTRPTAICNNNLQVVPGCAITVNPNSIYLGDTAEISWQIWPDFNIPTFMNISPVLVGSWPYNIYYKTGKTYVGPNISNTGTYTFSIDAWTTNGYPFSCTGELHVDQEHLEGILNIEKTLLTTGNFASGDFVEYGVILTNIGSGVFYNASIFDVMPSSLDLIYHNIIGVYPYNIHQWQDSSENRFFEYSGFDLLPGQSVQVNVKGQVRANATSNNTTNCAFANTKVSCVMFELAPEPYLQKYQSMVDSSLYNFFTTGILNVNIGDYITYKIDFANTGGGSTTGGVRILDHLPLCVEYVSSSISSNITNANFYKQQDMNGRYLIEYNSFDLVAGQAGYILVTGQIVSSPVCDNHLTYTNDAYLSFYNPMIEMQSSVTANRIAKSVVTIVKDSTPNIHPIGDNKLFKITLKNDGPNPISNIILDDIWPDDFSCISYVDWTGNVGLTKAPSKLIWTYPSLNSGDYLTLYISGKILNDSNCVASDYVNTIKLTYIEMGKDYTDSADYHFSVIGSHNVYLTKTPDKNIVKSGDLITYIITYKNNGDTTFLTHDLVDQLPAMVKYISASPSPSTYVSGATGPILTWNFGGLGVGQVGQIILTGKILHSNSSTITNRADIEYNTVLGTGGTSVYVTIVYQETSGPGYVGVCGNGQLDEGEECDLWYNINSIGNKIKIGTYLDLNQNYLANIYGNGGHYCQNCRIRAYQTNDFVYQPPQCLGTNTTISVMENEQIPFWWRLWDRQDQFVKSDYNCANMSDYESRTIINQDSMRCTFSIYDGNKHQQIDDNPLNTFVVDCYHKDNSVMFDYFEKAYKVNFDKVAGKYVYNTRHMFDGKADTYGEYKLVLERVDYDYCNPNSKTWEAGITYQGICEVDFALTRPYIMQISTFGISPTATSASDFLKDFYDMKGNSLISKTDIQDTIDVNSTTYGFDSSVSEQMTAFKQKYEALSIAIDNKFKVRGNKTIGDLFNNGVVKKVPNQMIFFVKGNGQLTLKQLTEFFPGTPFTIYVEGMDVLVEGSVKTNGMIITDGKISFEDNSSKGYCEEGGQIVHGIFVARGGFDSVSRTRNTNKNERRCPWGNLHVKGVLIGDGVNKLTENRRSHLNDWFSVKSNNESAIKRERRNEIFEGAALLIEYNPSLWTQLPPGADSFTKTLEVYKK